MDKVLNELHPQKVFHYFEEISQIPRGSKNEKKISDYLVAFAKERNLEVIQDEALNVIIKKEATKGFENAPTVILQGHMDMVCEKNKDTQHDFEKDPIRLKIEEDFILAKGTTLGADNGIAVAYALALLDAEDILHPKLEIVITADEEAGMSGALELDPQILEGKLLINIDTEEEGQLYVSCAGGVRGDLKIPIRWKKVKEDKEFFLIKLRGLQGGHSGIDIHQQRGNANKLLARVLQDIFSFSRFSFVEVNGGAKSNAIPREMDALICVKPEHIEKINTSLEKWNTILQEEMSISDPKIRLEGEVIESSKNKVFSKGTTQKVLQTLALHPDGIKSRSKSLEGLVESSLNLGVVTTTKEYVLLESAVRSSVDSLKEAMVQELQILAEVLEIEFNSHGEYPSWNYNPSSPLRELLIEVYKKLYQKEPEIKAIHAGLECGIFAHKLKDIDMISIGPNISGAHTPEEKMSISSVAKIWEYLLAILKEIPNINKI